MLTMRSLLSASVLLLLAMPPAASAQTTQTLTAAEAWTRIQHRYAATPPPNTVDTLKAGDPTTPVTGIATSFLDTMEVLREAASRGENLVISHEPTFYNHLDDTKAFTDDPVYKEKLTFINEHHMVVYRLHDQIHRSVDGDHILLGFYKAIGWEKLPHSTGPFGPYFVTVPPTTLGQLADTLRQRLHAGTVRVVGNPDLPIAHVAVVPGAAGLSRQVLALNQPQVDLLLAGEASEWETVEYVRDAVTQGRSKALILLGHEVTEEPGMEQCAEELRALFPAMKIDHIVAGQPLWSPEHPPQR
jgi:putative NIF3 family GTP cyclohydrolase 1 type 2